MKKPKTEGLERLWLSMASINGSGYMDKSSPEAYAQSYVMYKLWKNKQSDADLALNNWYEAVLFAEKLCDSVVEKKPSEKYYKKFIDFCENKDNAKSLDNTISLPL